MRADTATHTAKTAKPNQNTLRFSAPAAT